MDSHLQAVLLFDFIPLYLVQSLQSMLQREIFIESTLDSSSFQPRSTIFSLKQPKNCVKWHLLHNYYQFVLVAISQVVENCFWFLTSLTGFKAFKPNCREKFSSNPLCKMIWIHIYKQFCFLVLYISTWFKAFNSSHREKFSLNPLQPKLQRVILIKYTL